MKREHSRKHVDYSQFFIQVEEESDDDRSNASVQSHKGKVAMGIISWVLTARSVVAAAFAPYKYIFARKNGEDDDAQPKRRTSSADSIVPLHSHAISCIEKSLIICLRIFFGNFTLPLSSLSPAMLNTTRYRTFDSIHCLKQPGIS